MLYYVVFFFVKKYLYGHLRLALLVCLGAAMLFYIPFHTGQAYNMYGETYYKWVHYFVFMLQGAMLGVLSQQRKLSVCSGWQEALKALGCIVTFYALCAFKFSEMWNWLQVLSLIPLMGVTYYIYRWCNAPIARRLYHSRVAGFAVKAIGGLCLEIYLVQGNIFTPQLNSLFPLNLPLVFLAILLAAYTLRSLARIWSQTFQEPDYEWRKVFAIV